MRFAVASKVSDHYLCAWGELSSSGCAIHPGETPSTEAYLRRGLSTMTRARRPGLQLAVGHGI